jgi:epoxyqueuosine reductase
VTTAEAIGDPQAEYFSNWLAAGCAGQMQYMYKNIKKRINPAELLPEARSVICTALNYRPEKPNKYTRKQTSSHAKIANFALYQDYHKFIKNMLRRLVDFISQIADSDGLRFKICVDSVPILERAFAQRAGIGYIGKNHMLIDPQLGSQILLGEIITDLELVPDGPMTDACQGCDECLKACPTGALGDNGSFDANKCISYLTIEHAGQIPEALASKIGNRLFGCDECMLACPNEKKLPACANKELRYHPEFQQLRPAEILKWEQEKFDEFFADSCVSRLGLERLKRNAELCLKNLHADQGARKISSSSEGVSLPE